MRVLVTGGSGFLGAALCAELVGSGHDVVVLDDLSRGRSARLDVLGAGVELLHGDVRRYEDVRRATEGCDVVWHLAYVNGTRYFYERPDDVLEVGVKGAVNTLDAALDAGVRRYVLASTSETYQEPTTVPTPETEMLRVPDVRNPRFSYGGGKIASELLALHLGRRRGLESVVFRPHNLYGPDMGQEHVVPEVTRRLLDVTDGLRHSRAQLPIQGDGSQTRAFCHISDGAHGAFLAGTLGADGEIYNVGTDREISIHDLVVLIAAALGVDVEVVPGPSRAGGTARRCPDITKLRGLGYVPGVDLEDGLAETVRWYAEQYLGAGDRTPA